MGSWFHNPSAPGPYFPQTSEPPGASIDSLIDIDSNHPSFNELHGESLAPGLKQALELVQKGYGKLYPNRAAAEAELGPCHPAPLGNIRKLKPDGLS